MAKKLYMGSSSNNDDPVIDDTNDVVYRNSGKKVYAITRNPHCKSIWMVKLVNKMGEMGIFDRILERINDPNNWAPIEIVSIIITTLGNLSAILHRDFCYEYIPKLKDAVWKNILKSPDSNLRNFNKERIENIIQAFDSLLKRVVSIPEKNEALEVLQLEICSICFESDFLERKLQGLKILLDIIRNLKLNTTKFITPTQLNKFLSTHQILEKIYGQKGHVQLIQRSADFLKYMTTESNIEISDLELVWNVAIKGVMETKLSILKILSEIALNFKTDHLDFFIKKISDIPSSELIAEEIELVYELTRFSLKSSGFSKRVRDFYWTIISDQKNEFSTELVELTLNKFCDLMRTWELKEERLDVLYGCIDNLKKDVSSLASLKILKKIIDHYPAAAATTDKFTKSTCIEHLCKEKDLLTVLITDLKSFKAKLKERIPEGKEINEALLDSLVGERASFTTHINERLQFIHFTLANADSSEISLSYDYLSEIWDAVVKSSFVPGERDVVYKWIKETAESRGGFPMSISDLLKFFQEKMNDSQDFSNMTIEGFSCFKNVFLVINEKQNKINKVNTVVNHGTTNAIGVQYISYSYNSEESRAASDFDYKILVEPCKLEGIQSIWNFILSSENESVVEKAIDFLNKLYVSLDNDLEAQIVSIRQEFLTTCITKLREVLEARSKLSENAFTNSCVRCLSLIRSLLDETEKKGVGNLKSHSGLVKGEILTFTVVNEITSGVDVPKKSELRLPSNLTVFELRCEIGKIFKATWDQVKILRGLSQKEVKDNENGKTIGDIRVRNGETLTANKRSTPPIPQATLVYSDGALNPLAKRIFMDWFTTFSSNGKMNPDGCAAFIHSCTSDNCKGDDKRVKEVFATYDKDRDGFLTADDFVEFYYQAARQRPHVVWNNISAHHYRNDLKKVTEVEAEKVETSTLARYILCTNDEYFKLIFSLLDYGGKVSIDAWKLLNSLPTSPQIFADIVTLKGIRDNKDKKWDLILDSKSSYKLLYALTAIEYLMEDEGDEEENASNHLWTGHPELLEYKKNWRADFIVYGGFDHLFKIFNMYARNKQNTLTIFDKNILSFILKILKNYLTATFASSVPHLYRYLSFVRLFHLSLDFINDYLAGDVSKALAQEDKTAEADLPSNPKFKKSPSVAENDELAAALSSESSMTNPVVGPILKKTESKVTGEKAEDKKKEKYKIEETEEFRTLVERLKGDLGTHVIKTINLKEFIGLITSLGFDILNIQGDLESEDRMILEFSLSILVAILLYEKKNILYFINPENKADCLQGAANYILEGIFCSKSINIRRYFSHAFYILSKDTQTFENGVLSKYLVNLFLKNLPSSQDDTKKDCIQYFELLCKLIEESYSKNDSGDSSIFDTLIGQVVERIKTHQSTERRNNLHLNDKIFMGLIQLCEKILSCKPSLREVVGDPAKYNLVEYLFSTCLFDITDRENYVFQDMNDEVDANITSKDYVKAKSRDSRSATYKLLLTLCKDNASNSSVLLKNLTQLMSLITKITNTTSWGYSPQGDTKSFYGYLGIKNLGCICYMIAMLQQFFMTPAFRYGILMSDDRKEPNMVKKDNKWNIDDNVVHQLQQMFGFLELSDRQDYNPHEFCFSFKDFSGQPVNVSVQQDTQEFLNMIFDKLEVGLKHTPFKAITDSVYGGRTCGQIVCNGCGAIKEKVDPFYNLSVEVRNMKTLYDSLDKTIAGEIIEGYFCESCKKQQEITKRTCIESLPNVLIVHLQRIVFDLDTLMNQKINSRLEFPIDLNVEPYTREGLEWRERAKNKNKKAKQAAEGGEGDGKGDEKGQDEEVVGDKQESDPKAAPEEAPGPYKLHPKEYYEYKLAGVVVHVGTADFGHYYSYINTNRGDPSKRDKTKPDKWLEFNDSTIRDFDVKNLESECFGGANTDSSDDAWSWVKVGRENSKNAYILVYERVVKDPLKLVVTNEEDEAYLNKIVNPQEVKIVTEEVGEGDNKKVQKNYIVDYYNIKRFVPSRVYKKVWEDNHKFMFERHVYNEDFSKFIKEVCNSLKLPAMPADHKGIINPEHANLLPEQKKNIAHLIQVLTMQIFYLLARAHDNNVIVDLALNLRNLIQLAPECAWEFFETVALKDMKNTLDLMLICPDKNVRYYSSQLILFSINIMIAYHGLELNITKLKEREQNLANLTEEERYKHNIEDHIIKFLNLLIYIMPSDVAKNWLRFCQYFEFWRDFAFNGDAQLSFLFQKSFIAVLIDFFLEKRSPVPELSEKKHSMGNRYTDPEFNPLLQTVSLMVRRSHVVSQNGNIPFTSLAHQGMQSFPLSEYDLRCLYCPDFYDKATKDKYDSNAIGLIVQHFSFENENFSEMIAQILLRGLNRSNFEDAKTYLETMTYFLIIYDHVQNKRIEWLLGYPQPMTNPTRNGGDNFGIYGKSDLEDVVISYDSTLFMDQGQSIINLMLTNRKRLENLCLVLLKQVLQIMDMNPVVFEYVISLPPPSYNYAKFTDWMQPFIEYYLVEAKRYNFTVFQKEEMGQETMKIYKAIEEKVNKRIELYENMQKINDPNFVVDQDSRLLKSIYKPYIIGQALKEEAINTEFFSDPSESFKIYFTSSEVTCYTTDSKPVGNGNLAFPADIQNENRLLSSEIKSDSPFAHFIVAGKSDTENRAVIISDVEAAMKATKIGVEDRDDIAPILDDDDVENHLLNEQEPVDAPMQDGSDTEIDSKGSNHEDPGDVPEKLPSGDQKEETKENTVEITTEKQPEPETIPPQVFDFKFEARPVIRRFIIFNESPYHLDATITFNFKQGSYVNFRMMNNPIRQIVRPKSNFCLFSILKQVADRDWGDYEVKCTIKRLENMVAQKPGDDSGKKKNIFHIRQIDTTTRVDGVPDDRI